ncbi:CDP-glycerol glycerophosphotransferase family protein [Trujillonella endophytica]|uniref:CDP-glycerol glycerophosphotransferase, TagB/SpsB family n=1 Tax=Trujillonella endophytica TaxID=673521 RepID=A0A1H8W537_9ACTN|nr:CDP-glycerol glycerophosphotransferase family protein [Trujillella endophytica]SEP22761.1 CDP-glycerol glycerophosphotransferase, TagB/SpsB family [Trujillella endophytica]
MAALLRRLRSSAMAVLGWLGMRLLPARRLAVVHGYPDSEGNALHTLAELTRRYPGPIHWLVADPASVRLLGPLRVDPARVTVVPRRSVRAIRSTLTAEAVFFTHGLVTAARPPRSRLVVNLWHGDGPKDTKSEHRAGSTVVVSGTELWGRMKGAAFDVPFERVAVVGNPRVADLTAPLDRAQLLAALGLPADRLLVLWMPTYRVGGDEFGRSWGDGSGLSSRLSEAFSLPDGVQLVVKPHPLDRDDYTGLGARVITNADLAAVGSSTYRLMAAADALISDASSTWTDYLVLDRPIGFFMPDLGEYGASRGYNVPDVREVLPGPLFEDLAGVRAFLGAVEAGEVPPPSGHPAVARLGLSRNERPAEALLTWLDDHRTRAGRRALFGSGSAAQ